MIFQYVFWSGFHLESTVVAKRDRIHDVLVRLTGP